MWIFLCFIQFARIDRLQLDMKILIWDHISPLVAQCTPIVISVKAAFSLSLGPHRIRSRELRTIQLREREGGGGESDRVYTRATNTMVTHDPRRTLMPRYSPPMLGTHTVCKSRYADGL